MAFFTKAQVQNFSFLAQALPQKLAEFVPRPATGYWQLQFDRLLEREVLNCWHLGSSEGKIRYSGSQRWTSQALLKVIQRYCSSTRQSAFKSYISELQQDGQDLVIAPAQLIAQLKQRSSFTEAQLQDALRLKVLSDLDTYCLMGSGLAEFVPDRSLSVQLPIDGFEVQSLMNEVMHRQFVWHQLRQQIHSMNAVPVLDPAALHRSSLPAAQQARIKSWTQSGKTLQNIAVGLAKDSFEVAKIFAKLASAEIVGFNAAPQAGPSTIMIIDDSPLVLRQFESWVTALGYPVVVCQEAKAALTAILQINPAVIFIDINMPNISGFELAKQIRQTPQLSDVPLVILTGEQKMSNKWRAQWSGCDFLTKPLSMSEVGLFHSHLQELLQRLLHGSTADVA